VVCAGHLATAVEGDTSGNEDILVSSLRKGFQIVMIVQGCKSIICNNGDLFEVGNSLIHEN